MILFLSTEPMKWLKNNKTVKQVAVFKILLNVVSKNGIDAILRKLKVLVRFHKNLISPNSTTT